MSSGMSLVCLLSLFTFFSQFLHLVVSTLYTCVLLICIFTMTRQQLSKYTPTLLPHPAPLYPIPPKKRSLKQKKMNCTLFLFQLNSKFNWIVNCWKKKIFGEGRWLLFWSCSHGMGTNGAGVLFAYQKLGTLTSSSSEKVQTCAY